jgi:hypothetical protein
MLETIIIVAAVAAALLYVAGRLKKRIDLLKNGPTEPPGGCPGCLGCSDEPEPSLDGDGSPAARGPD